MDRSATAVVKCNYKEIDRQLKEQFIHVVLTAYLVIYTWFK